MDIQNRMEQARKRMHRAEDALKYYALSGGQDLEEYARLLDAARAMRDKFLSQAHGSTGSCNPVKGLSLSCAPNYTI
jgi:hypothetical protein